MIKLIASDMDGTLLNSDHIISKENLEAIKKARKWEYNLQLLQENV